jgi:excisionase family DNA binding protein
MGEVALKFEQVWFTTAEAAEYLRITRAALQKQVERGNIVPDNRHVGRVSGFRFRRETLDRFQLGG